MAMRLSQQLGSQVPIKGKTPPKPLSAPLQKHALSDEEKQLVEWVHAEFLPAALA